MTEALKQGNIYPTCFYKAHPQKLVCLLARHCALHLCPQTRHQSGGDPWLPRTEQWQRDEVVSFPAESPGCAVKDRLLVAQSLGLVELLGLIGMLVAAVKLTLMKIIPADLPVSHGRHVRRWCCCTPSES